MAKLPRHSGIVPLLCSLTLILAACAATPRKPALAPPEVQNATPQGNLITGAIAAIRPVSAQNALPASAAQVLAALQISAPAQAPNATEFVIQRSDGSAAAIVVRSPASSPGASMSASDFAVGDQVELLTGEQTELIHPNP